MVLCVDDVIIIAKSKTKIDFLLNSLKNGIDMDTGLERDNLQKFLFADDGSIKTFLGVNVERKKIRLPSLSASPDSPHPRSSQPPYP